MIYNFLPLSRPHGGPSSRPGTIVGLWLGGIRQCLYMVVMGGGYFGYIYNRYRGIYREGCIISVCV